MCKMYGYIFFIVRSVYTHIKGLFAYKKDEQKKWKLIEKLHELHLTCHYICEMNFPKQ